MLKVKKRELIKTPEFREEERVTTLSSQTVGQRAGSVHLVEKLCSFSFLLDIQRHSWRASKAFDKKGPYAGKFSVRYKDDPNWWTHSLLREGYGKDKHWVLLRLMSCDSASSHYDCSRRMQAKGTAGDRQWVRGT